MNETPLERTPCEISNTCPGGFKKYGIVLSEVSVSSKAFKLFCDIVVSKDTAELQN